MVRFESVMMMRNKMDELGKIEKEKGNYYGLRWSHIKC